MDNKASDPELADRLMGELYAMLNLLSSGDSSLNRNPSSPRVTVTYDYGKWYLQVVFQAALLSGESAVQHTVKAENPRLADAILEAANHIYGRLESARRRIDATVQKSGSLLVASQLAQTHAK